MNATRFFGVAVALMLGCGALVLVSRTSRTDAVRHTAGKPIVAVDGLTVGQGITFGNLTIFPVTSQKPREKDRFITLDEGLRTGKVEVREKGAVPNPEVKDEAKGESEADVSNDPFYLPGQQDPFRGGNDVNTLVVINNSDKPLYLMPGEVIVGGDQDRTIEHELVIAPGGKPTDIAVYCVEHGRWGRRSQADYTAYLEAPSGERPFVTSVIPVTDGAVDLAKAGGEGKFVGSVGNLNKGARLAVQKGDGQGAVWTEVGKQNEKSGAVTETDTFTANLSLKADDLEPYLEKLEQPIAETKNIVGVIVAVNGKVETLDVFESTPLFRKLWPKLLKSYTLDATSADATETKAIADTFWEANAFFRATAAAKGQAKEGGGDLAHSQHEDERVLLFSAHERPKDAAPAAGFGGGGISGAIHASGFAK